MEPAPAPPVPPEPPRKRPTLAAEPQTSPAPEAGPERQRYKFTRPAVTPVNTREGTPIDVNDILRDNTAREIAAHLKPLQFVPRRSRRKRDFWICFIAGNAAAAVSLVYLLPHNPATLIFGLSGVVIFNLSLVFVVWFVMSDY